MSKINNFGITEDDINWRAKDNYMMEDDAIAYEATNIYRGVAIGYGAISGRGYSDGDGFHSIDVEGLNELKGISCGFGSGDGHSYKCFREEGEGVGYGSASGSGNSTGLCVS